MNRSRLARVDHPLLPLFQRAVDSLTVGMVPDSARPYRGVARHFLIYLESDTPTYSLSLSCAEIHTSSVG
jgi:hypothetical protein